LSIVKNNKAKNQKNLTLSLKINVLRKIWEMDRNIFFMGESFGKEG